MGSPACLTANNLIRCPDCDKPYFASEAVDHPRFCREGANGYFWRDMDGFDESFRNAGAIITCDDGTFIDQSKLPVALVDAYRGLIEYGYATGLLGPEVAVA